MKRITVITDSLGMPRDCTPIEKTWTELLKLYLAQNFTHIMGGGVITYFFPQRGLHTQDILNKRNDLLLYQKSDIVIIQTGVVDACRRVMPRNLEWRIESLPLIGRIYSKFVSHFRFKLTHLYNFHYVDLSHFQENIIKICNDIYQANPYAKIIWIKIAPPGKGLISKVYAIQQDIDLYNNILEQCADKKSFEILDPYIGHNTQQITIQDGHHLSEFGHQLVYQILQNRLKNYLEKLP
ncbi:SGNH/GDSL hydrolase family protein [Helicobacter equorum]|uniref:SGNH/GDSL hydrolase family protein n=1 Tax=Helicobacter equorum TaxID=361872 RepID=A0A3D8IKP9_9HELI|nr:SGNH/GDSL hydrolase family protein [Helicobacter equorum]RDU65758.1 SGNH/GDSL hydrolase family protein [Helicobacter equorum]